MAGAAPKCFALEQICTRCCKQSSTENHVSTTAKCCACACNTCRHHKRPSVICDTMLQHEHVAYLPSSNHIHSSCVARNCQQSCYG
jgi:hypothetical protein